jgi:hypothetical protein
MLISEHLRRYVVPFHPSTEIRHEANLLPNSRRHISLVTEQDLEAIEVAGQSTYAQVVGCRCRAVIPISHCLSPHSAEVFAQKDDSLNNAEPSTLGAETNIAII